MNGGWIPWNWINKQTQPWGVMKKRMWFHLPTYGKMRQRGSERRGMSEQERRRWRENIQRRVERFGRGRDWGGWLAFLSILISVAVLVLWFAILE